MKALLCRLPRALMRPLVHGREKAREGRWNPKKTLGEDEFDGRALEGGLPRGDQDFYEGGWGAVLWGRWSGGLPGLSQLVRPESKGALGGPREAGKLGGSRLFPALPGGKGSDLSFLGEGCGSFPGLHHRPPSGTSLLPPLLRRLPPTEDQEKTGQTGCLRLGPG